MAIISIDSHIFRNSGQFDIVQVINDGQTAASSDALDVREAKGVTLVVETGAGVSNGTVLLEGAASSTYSGTWVSLGSITTNAASTAFKAGYEQDTGPFPYVRARISSGLTGGTCDIYIMVQK